MQPGLYLVLHNKPENTGTEGPYHSSMTDAQVLDAYAQTVMSVAEHASPTVMREEESMKSAKHPTSGETSIVCACGATYTTRSTVPHLRVAVCTACHPWWTGRQKLVDTAGQVEKFQRKYARHNTHN